MTDPILNFKLDEEKYWWVLREEPREWVICFTATYSKELHRKKELLIWRIDGIGPDEKERIRRELTRRAGAKKIVHLVIYCVIEPQTDEEIEFIKNVNRRLKAERGELKKAG